jgi:hypothetical protein
MGLLENQTYILDQSTEQAAQDTTINIGLHEKKDFFDVNKSNPFALQDYHSIVRGFEQESTNWIEDDYALATHYRDVYETRNFSERTRSQMDYYPGMHQSSSPPSTDPAYTNAKRMSDSRQEHWNNALSSPDAFMNGLRSRKNNFDYTKIFGSDVSAKTRAQNLGRVLTECVPCFNRITDKDSLLPDGDLLSIHALNIRLRTGFLKEIMALFGDSGAYIDICELIKLFASLCPQDLLSLISLLSQYLAKLNLDIKFNLDFIISLVGPLLSPFLDGLSQWLDKWMQMILEPVLCVVDHINEVIITAQTIKIPIKDTQISTNIALGTDSSIAGKNMSTGIGFGGFYDAESEEYRRGYHGEAYFDEIPSQEKYNPDLPDYPVEEAYLSGQETKESWKSVKYGKLEERDPVARKELNERWAKAKKEYQERQRQNIEKEKRRRDPSRWDKDSYNPPEKLSSKPVEAQKYFDPEPLVNSIVQLRNMVQGAVQYMKDWFTYVTQMIYDLLGVEIGWMSKKTGTSYLKTNLIQMIKLIQAIVSSIAKNGLECGTNTQLTPAQMKTILEDNLNEISSFKFNVDDDGTIKMLPPSGNLIQVKNNSDEQSKKAETKTIPSAVGPVTEPTTTEAKMKEKIKESGIIIKSCLKDISSEELTKVRSWISEFERRAT